MRPFLLIALLLLCACTAQKTTTQTTLPVTLTIDRQLEAYNAQDIDAFMQSYTNDIKIYDYPNRLTMDGSEQVRSTYERMFLRLPELHAVVLERIVDGHYVIDRERLTGLPNGDTLTAIAIYTVTDGKISEVRFIR